jgi:hypothetical protein
MKVKHQNKITKGKMNFFYLFLLYYVLSIISNNILLLQIEYIFHFLFLILFSIF